MGRRELRIPYLKSWRILVEGSWITMGEGELDYHGRIIVRGSEGRGPGVPGWREKIEHPSRTVMGDSMHTRMIFSAFVQRAPSSSWDFISLKGIK